MHFNCDMKILKALKTELCYHDEKDSRYVDGLRLAIRIVERLQTEATEEYEEHMLGRMEYSDPNYGDC